MNRSQHHNAKGFTLLEVLLVVGIISILAGIVILAINPSKQLGDTRNANRRADVNTILNAVYQYEIDSNGALPGAGNVAAATKITAAAVEICKTGVANATCNAGPFVDLTDLTLNGKYLVSLPIDPAGSATNGTKYTILQSATTSRITVAATVTDNSATITATR